jgi:hypothetical protein
LYYSKESGYRNLVQALILRENIVVKWWPNIAHVAEKLFLFYSTLIWQDSIASTMIGSLSSSPWFVSLAMSDECIERLYSTPNNETAYNLGLIAAIEKHTGTTLIEPITCLNATAIGNEYPLTDSGDFDSNIQWPLTRGWPPTYWFLHPSDALQLGSTILNTDPCFWYNQSYTLKNQAVTVLLLDRKHSRIINNTQTVVEDLVQSFKETSSYSSSSGSDSSASSDGSDGSNTFMYHTISMVSVESFENKSFYEQVQAARNADVLIAIHGAGLINMAFMRPCSIVLEIFHWGYNEVDYFKGLAHSAGLIREHWVEGYNNVEYLFDDAFSSATCRDIINGLHRDGNSHDSSWVRQRCMDLEGPCRRCIRDVSKVTISLEPLRRAMDYAMKRRRVCMEKSMYYSPSS